MTLDPKKALEVKHCKAPCAECPYSRKAKPGGTGGSPPVRYIGQAFGPFWLPCHMLADQTNLTKVDFSIPQCGGAAIFRANVGVAEAMPATIHTLPAGHPDVFATPAELLAHHYGMPMEMMNAVVTPLFIRHATDAELGKLAPSQFHDVEKKSNGQ